MKDGICRRNFAEGWHSRGMDPGATEGGRRSTKDMQPCCSLARDYRCVGTKGSLIRRWCADELGGKVASVGNDGDGYVMISSDGGVQVRSWTSFFLANWH